ncbi:hypothetical protein BC939DRAFT_438150 [Gamsiella multidivaricata]|uniref:uncharacterized protein n=1 Tax=Gamsiella multidivaricata TaxID=101098 RepID=UPI00221EE101|nr:uncharacterized protein BC939DRAFT_438150 [Gamsiella multidivaricata]KAI7831291.1 hypothetical protein BC939DRAFT_438150 [Gamsiella multidivaricata]
MDSKRENKLLAFLNGSAEEDQDPVKFFEWAGYPSWNEGHAGAVWKTTVRGLDAEKAIVLETRWANSKDRRREYWEKLRRKEEAAKKMEEWSQKIENVNSNEQDIVFEFQHHRFKKFMDDKISPFITKDEPSPPYTPPFPNKRPREAFAGGSESSWEVLMPGDIIDALQEMLPHQRMGELLGLKREHIFSCVLEDVDMGALFTQYFEACCLESYKHGYPEDALALSATLLIKKNSRSPRLLKAFGGQRLTALRETLLKSIVPTLDTTLLDKQQALISKWVRWVCLVSENRRENMAKRMDTLDQLHSDWKEAKDLDLAAMHTYFVMCIQGLFASQPLDFQEADGIASFIRNLLAAFLQEVDLVRFSCADKGSEASRYNKAINQLQGKSKQPDMVGIFTYEGVKVETFFGEASSVAAKSTFKYGGDTIRLGVFGKNGHDMINNLVDLEVPLLLFNINGLVLQAFVLEKVQDIYAMLEIGTGRIPCSVNDLLFLSQDLPFWLQLREIAKKTSASIERAVDAGQIDYERRKSFYPTITTPSARGALSSAK